MRLCNFYLQPFVLASDCYHGFIVVFKALKQLLLCYKYRCEFSHLSNCDLYRSHPVLERPV